MDEKRRDASLLSVVIPLFNEGDHLQQVIDKVVSVLSELQLPYELLLIDDGSRDHTWRSIKELTASNEAIRGLRFSRNFGKESALAAGLDGARGDGVVLLDGDLQHPPELIKDMVRLWRDEGADVVEAVKSKRGKEPFWHRLCAKLFYGMLGGLPGDGLQGATDFKLLDRSAVDAWRSMGERNIFFRGMSAWLGFERREVYFSVPDRVGGSSRWPLLQLMRLATTGITSFTSLPLHLTTLIGFLFLLFSFVVGGHTLYMKFSGQAVSGFATVILLLLITGSCILISIGIVGIYIARIYEEVKRRPRYLVSERVKW